MQINGDIPVTYTNGVLKPDRGLGFPEGARLSIAINDRRPTADSRRRGWELIERIRREQLVRLTGMRWTRDDLYDRR